MLHLHEGDAVQLHSLPMLAGSGWVFAVKGDESGLIPADSSGNSDPYVAARLGDKTKKSKVAKKTLDPEFGEELSFTIEDASTAEEVVLTVMDKDHGAKDDFLGDVHISLADVFLLITARRPQPTAPSSP